MRWAFYLALPAALISFGMGLYYLFKAEDWAENTVREKGLTGFEATNERKNEVRRHTKEALSAFLMGGLILYFWFI